jgi:hypothetical protein
LGLALELEGRKADAHSELQIAANMKPDFKPAQDDLKRVK